jgi:uncharacterized protein involved in exopolysaccharide biosynthesis
MDTRTHSPVIHEQISLKEVIEDLWLRKWTVIALCAILVVSAATAAILLPKKYEASVLVSPETNTPGGTRLGGLGSVVSQFGGLASLAGLSVGMNSHAAETVAVLKSRALTEAFIQQNDLLPTLYPKLWDSKLKRWKVTDPRKVPTLWKANREFDRDIRFVSSDPKTGLVTLSIHWRDPQQAAAWANGLVKETNDYLRAKAIAKADRNISYLEAQAAQTEMLGVKQAIYSILENEIDTEMLARGSAEYALKVLDPAQAPQQPSSPEPLLWVLLALFAGILLSVLAAFIRVAWRTG